MTMPTDNDDHDGRPRSGWVNADSDAAERPAEPDRAPERGGPSELEAAMMRRLNLNRDSLPDGFTWREHVGKWVRTVTVDPAGEYGFTEQEAHRLNRIVEKMNEAVGADAFDVQRVEHYRRADAYGARRN
jgi:hypothetical protein